MADRAMNRDVLDLFSAAAGGWSLGMHRAGFMTVAACEVVPWRRALYSENNPGVKVYDDVRTLTADRLLADLGRLPSVVVGSPPCQDISSANAKGKGVEGARSGLYFEAIRIIGECRPRWFALENSANLRTRGADAVLAAMEAINYACWPVVVRASDIGANHERPRCWIIGCDLGQVGDPAEVGCRSGLSGRRSGPVAGSEQPPCWDAPDANGNPLRIAELPGRSGQEAPISRNPDQAADANTPSERSQGQSGRDEQRQGEVAERADIPARREMGLRARDRGHPDRGRADWSLDDLADRVQLDDGVSAWLAGTRVSVGDGKGQSAASLIVEAFGDAVIPQIPEAIGRAILRTEAALTAVYRKAAA